jgi:hypothetical protein
MQVTPAQNEWVARVLGYAVAGPTPRREGDGIRLAKCGLLWNQTHSHAREQVKALQAAIRAATSSRPDFSIIDTNTGRIDEIFEVLDDRLTKKLGDVQAATDAAEKQKLMDECRGIVGDYQTFVESDWLMLHIDANGFIPLDIHARVSAVLNAILANL